jgi:hypothetical protein
MGSRTLHGEVGDPCPRCGLRTQVRAHIEITEQQLRQPWYYSRWFVCVNRDCRTTLIMPERFKVFRKGRRRRSRANVGISAPRENLSRLGPL